MDRVWLTQAEEAALALLAKDGDKAARERLIEDIEGLVHWLAVQYERPGIAHEDLQQEGLLSAIMAIDSFDPSLSRWRSWAALHARAAMRKARARAALVAVPSSRRRQAREYRETRDALIAETGFEPEPGAIAEAIGVSVESLDSVIMAAEGAASRPLGGIDALSLAPAHEEPTAEEAQNAEAAERHDAEMRRRIRSTILEAGGDDLEADLVTAHVLDGVTTTQLCLRSRTYRLNHSRTREAIDRGMERLRVAWRERPARFMGTDAAA